MKEGINELFVDDIYSLEAVINLNGWEIVDNNHDIECKVVPDPELGDVGVTIKRTLEVKDV